MIIYPNHDQIMDIPQQDRKQKFFDTQEKNLIYRLDMLQKAENDENMQKAIITMLREDIMLFFDLFLWTYNPKISPNHFVFVLYPFQKEIIKEIRNSIQQWYDTWHDKTREMWFSWIVLGIFLYWRLLHNHSYLIGSYKEDYVHKKWDMDSAFERIFYMLERLPKRLKPKKYYKNYKLLYSDDFDSEIAWDSGQYFGTWWRRKAVLLDEFAYRSFDETAKRKTTDVTDCRIFVSTPEWKWNVFGKVMTGHKEYQQEWLKKFHRHWTMHPLKTQERYENEKKRRTKLEIAKELDISYDDSVTWAVYPWFKEMAVFWLFPYDPYLPLYRTYDFGRDANVCIRIQKDPSTANIYIVDAVKREDRDIRKFWWLVTWEPTQWFAYEPEDYEVMERVAKYKRTSKEIWDPYNSKSRTTNADRSIYQIFRDDFRIHLTLPKTEETVESRIKWVTLALDRVYINTQLCEDVINALSQSRYPKLSEWSQATSEKTKPVHDENSHYRTAIEYFFAAEPKSVTGVAAWQNYVDRTDELM